MQIYIEIIKQIKLLCDKYKTGLDTNGCPLGNSKIILLSDNLNICLWLSACLVEEIDQINNLDRPFVRDWVNLTRSAPILAISICFIML